MAASRRRAQLALQGASRQLHSRVHFTTWLGNPHDNQAGDGGENRLENTPYCTYAKAAVF